MTLMLILFLDTSLFIHRSSKVDYNEASGYHNVFLFVFFFYKIICH